MVRDNDDVDTLLYASLSQTIVYDLHQIVSVDQRIIELVSVSVYECVCVGGGGCMYMYVCGFR